MHLKTILNQWYSQTGIRDGVYIVESPSVDVFDNNDDNGTLPKLEVVTHFKVLIMIEIKISTIITVTEQVKISNPQDDIDEGVVILQTLNHDPNHQRY